MARRRGLRTLVVGEDLFLWQARHKHRVKPAGAAAPRCQEVVTFWHSSSKARLDLVFDEEAGFVSAGLLHSDAAHQSGALNLHRPGVARALLDEAVARGWQPGRPGQVEMNGWDTFDRCVARRAAVEAER